MLQPSYQYASSRAVWISHLCDDEWLVKLDYAMPLADQVIIGCAVHEHARVYHPRTRTWSVHTWQALDLLDALARIEVAVHGGPCTCGADTDAGRRKGHQCFCEHRQATT